MLPFISVVMPLYNKQDFVARAITSVLTQSYSSFELIVVDDGSTDASRSVIKEFSDEPGLTLCEQNNLGSGAARNTGIATAKGSWIAFIDADDEWTHGHLSEIANLIEQFPYAGMVATRCGENALRNRTKRKENGCQRYTVDYFEEAARDLKIVHTSSVAVARAAFESVGRFGPYPRGQDLEMWARVALSFPVAVSTLQTAVYNRGTGGVMDKSSDRGKSNRKLPESLADMGHSVRLLSFELNHLDKNSDRYKSVAHYINSRLDHRIRNRLAEGDILRAKKTSALYLSPRTSRSMFWHSICAVPVPILSAVSIHLNRMQRARHAFKSR